MAMRMSVEQPLWRALTGYRLLAAGYAVLVYAWAYHDFAHPAPGAVYVFVLVAWTLATLPKVASAGRCTRAFLCTDLALAIAGILLSMYVDADGLVGPTLPTIWVAGSVLAFAIKGGWRYGAVSAALVSAVNIVETGGVGRTMLHNALLVCVASVGIGYAVEVARASERTLARALQIEAATRERERLARDIHDSVLQVLAMVQRRGASLGGEAAELGRMAGEQEVALRALVSHGPGGADAAEPEGGADRPSAARPVEPETAERAAPPAAREAPDGTGTETEPEGEVPADDPDARSCDLRALLSPYAGARVSFAEPGSPVPLRAGAARELAAAVGAALDNVRRHARGTDDAEARAWILVEDEPEEVVVTVRDEGPGIPPGRLADAEAEGRLGVALSIRGRLRDLGGTAEWVSVPGQGTEVELRVPRARTA